MGGWLDGYVFDAITAGLNTYIGSTNGHCIEAYSNKFHHRMYSEFCEYITCGTVTVSQTGACSLLGLFEIFMKMFYCGL